MLCLHCQKEIEKGIEVLYGVLCSSCESEEMEVFKVTHSSYSGWIALSSRKEAEEMVEIESKEEENLKDDFTIESEKMKIIDFYNLPEWDGW